MTQLEKRVEEEYKRAIGRPPRVKAYVLHDTCPICDSDLLQGNVFVYCRDVRTCGYAEPVQDYRERQESISRAMRGEYE